MKHLIALASLCLLLPAAHADLFISNPKLNFNTTPVDGLGKTATVSIQNLNAKPAHVTISNSCFDNFYVTDGCDITLEQNQACNVTIRFQPYQFGQVSCSIAVQDSLGDNGMIEVTGWGVQP